MKRPTVTVFAIIYATTYFSLINGATLINETENTIEVRYEQHRFTPNKIEVRAGRPLVLTITNASAERIEFESFKLNREKVITPGETLVLRFPALREGAYDFYDDFHQDVPEGVIRAR